MVYTNSMRIDRMLSNSGYGTRSVIKDLIRHGKVTVNGVVCKDPGMHVKDTDVIECAGQTTTNKSNLYFVFDKPDGVLTAMEDKRLPTVADFIPDHLKNLKLSPVGRLDYHTTGLLIITNDGELSHRLTSPKYGIPKTYLVTYEGGALPESAIEELAAGLTLRDTDECVTLRPSKLILIDDHTCKIILTEGKTHEVRRIIAHYGRSVATLRRIELGPIDISQNSEGELRELSDEERENLLRSVNLL